MTRLTTATTLLTAFLAALHAAYSATEMKIDVYEGPTECEEADKVAPGKYLAMHYVGTFDETSETGEKGKKFDSSRDRENTFNFQIGQGDVIKGWDEGLIGLCKGAKAKMVIPPDMGYGEDGAGETIPGGATLNFDIEVVDISDKDFPQPNYFEMIDTDKDGVLNKEEVESFFKNKMLSDVPEGLWEHEDKNGDGVISFEEFSGPKGEEEDDMEDIVEDSDNPSIQDEL